MLRLVLRLLLCFLLTCVSLAGSSLADSPPSGTSKATRAQPLGDGEAQTKPSPLPRKPVPRTRFTVRQKSETTEPTAWLRRFGKVEARQHAR